MLDIILLHWSPVSKEASRSLIASLTGRNLRSRRLGSVDSISEVWSAVGPGLRLFQLRRQSKEQGVFAEAA